MKNIPALLTLFLLGTISATFSSEDVVSYDPEYTRIKTDSGTISSSIYIYNVVEFGTTPVYQTWKFSDSTILEWRRQLERQIDLAVATDKRLVLVIVSETERPMFRLIDSTMTPEEEYAKVQTGISSLTRELETLHEQLPEDTDFSDVDERIEESERRYQEYKAAAED